jgi:phosphoglycerate kinase
MKFKEITKEKVAGKRVLVRACLDVPVKNGKITDDTRLKTAVPTIKWLIDAGASVVLITKMGRPEGKKVKALSLSQVVKPLSELLDQKVLFVLEAMGAKAEKAVKSLKPGEILLLENLRFYPGEEENDPKFAEKLASYGDIFVMDDFPNVKNDHAGITGVTKYLPSYAGINFATEVETLTKAFDKPTKPFVAIIAGAKISTKIER